MYHFGKIKKILRLKREYGNNPVLYGIIPIQINYNSLQWHLWLECIWITRRYKHSNFSYEKFCRNAQTLCRHSCSTCVCLVGISCIAFSCNRQLVSSSHSVVADAMWSPLGQCFGEKLLHSFFFAEKQIYFRMQNQISNY